MKSALVVFNTPLETGVRLLILLTTAYPLKFSLDHLVMLDHVLVHTDDFGGPQSVHPASPFRIAEPFVRRNLIQKALVLFQSRGLISEQMTGQGFLWEAEDAAAPFVSYLTTTYHRSLILRAEWTVKRFGNEPETSLAATMGERVVTAMGVGGGE